ncbi:hypothetical protein EKH55_3196 [Sinorhizobium alkalisoli]|nr:hypothetical protein EKH55_3196 [Sinorhizobium alkalisoli]
MDGLVFLFGTAISFSTYRAKHCSAAENGRVKQMSISEIPRAYTWPTTV